jgi:membrane protein
VLSAQKGLPALIALVSIIGLIGRSGTEPLRSNLGGFAPGPAHEILDNALHGLEQSRGGAGVLFFIGIAGRAARSSSSWSGSGSRTWRSCLGPS